MYNLNVISELIIDLSIDIRNMSDRKKMPLTKKESIEMATKLVIAEEFTNRINLTLNSIDESIVFINKTLLNSKIA